MRTARALLLLITAAALIAATALVLTGSGGTDLGTLWHGGAPESLNLTQAIIQRYIHPAVWTAAILPVLLMPAAVVFLAAAVLAALLLSATFLGKRRDSVR